MGAKIRVGRARTAVLRRMYPFRTSCARRRGQPSFGCRLTGRRRLHSVIAPDAARANEIVEVRNGESRCVCDDEVRVRA